METLYYSGNLTISDTIVISDENEFRHAVKSLRKKTGDKIRVTNGRGDLFTSEISSIGRNELSLILKEKLNDDVDYLGSRVYIALALLNQNSKMKLAVEKLTELGISGFLPIQAERTVFPDKNLKGLEASAISALKQCGGSVLPEIYPLLSFTNLLNYEHFEHKYYCHFSDEKNIDKKIDGKILIAIGPEGGWTDVEINRFQEHGFKALSLNKRVLRAETAALVAAARFLQ